MIEHNLPNYIVRTRIPQDVLKERSGEIIDCFPLYDGQAPIVEGYSHVDMRDIFLNFVIGSFAPCLRVKIEVEGDTVCMRSKPLNEDGCNLCLKVTATRGGDGFAVFEVDSEIHLDIQSFYKIVTPSTHKNIVTRLLKIWEYRFLYGDTRTGDGTAPSFSRWK